ncbi:LysE family translocator [Phaeobacter sp.]|uniref:LysE family translocator n=1 Tax=Phaeobacter sp. TaxID=1902409 RepID=UPI0025D3D8F1|nr:LysE family translocator [Phaeobacter sp.]
MTQPLLALLIFLFPLAYSPGPGNLFFAANGARFGFRATLPANAGYHIATWWVTAAIGLGLVSVLDQTPALFAALKLAGSIYVLWLAWRLCRSGPVDTEQKAQTARFRDGVILLLLNPKAYVIIALMFSQFLPQEAPNPLTSALLITTVFTLNNLVAFSIWALLGDRLAKSIRATGQAQKTNLFFGLMLGAVGLWMLIA